MPTSSRICLIAALATMLLGVTGARAGGLIERLPPDGTWAIYQVVSKGLDKDGNEITARGSVTISSVGQTEENGEKCRLIEIKSLARQNEVEHQTIDKLLIPEKDLQPGKKPLDQLSGHGADKFRPVKWLPQGSKRDRASKHSCPARSTTR